MKKKKREENYQLEMLEGAKLIGAGAATIASAGAAIGIGNVLSSSIHSVARNPSLAKQSFGYAILGFALTEAIASFAPMMAFLISSVFRSKNQRKKVWERSWSGKAKTAPRIWVARGRLCPDGGALWGRAQPNRDSTPPTSSAPLYRLNHSKGLIGGTGEPRELAVDSFIREGKKGPKHGRCRTLEWKRKARPYLFFQACSDIRFPREIKLMSRVMGNLPARFGEH
ncbi:ATPase subunit 9 [Tanacetum coccineum]